MGLFDFMKEIGKKLFSKEEDAAKRSKKTLKRTTPVSPA